MDSEIIKLTEDLMSIKEELSTITSKEKELQEKKKKAEYALYYAMENKDIRNFKHDVYGTIFRSHRIFCDITDFDKACKFLKEKGVFDEVMKLKPNRSRLNKLMQAEYVDKDEPVIEGEIGIQATLIPKIGNRGGKTFSEGGDNSIDSSNDVAVEY